MDSKTTLTEIIANALREALRKRRRKAPQKKTRLITYGKGGTFPGIDISGSATLLDIMDGIIDPPRP